MRQVWLGIDRQPGAIVLDIFGWVGIGVGKLCNFYLVSVGENHLWSGDGIDLSFRYLVHRLQFADVTREVRRVGRDKYHRFMGKFKVEGFYKHPTIFTRIFNNLFGLRAPKVDENALRDKFHKYESSLACHTKELKIPNSTADSIKEYWENDKDYHTFLDELV